MASAWNRPPPARVKGPVGVKSCLQPCGRHLAALRSAGKDLEFDGATSVPFLPMALNFFDGHSFTLAHMILDLAQFTWATEGLRSLRSVVDAPSTTF